MPNMAILTGFLPIRRADAIRQLWALPRVAGAALMGALHESESAHRRHAPAGAARAVAQEHLVGCQKAVPMINGDLALVGSGTEDGAARGAAGVSRVTPG